MADAAGSRRVSVANGFTSDGDALIDAGRAAAREQTLSRVLHLQQPRNHGIDWSSRNQGGGGVAGLVTTALDCWLFVRIVRIVLLTFITCLF